MKGTRLEESGGGSKASSSYAERAGAALSGALLDKNQIIASSTEQVERKGESHEEGECLKKKC